MLWSNCRQQGGWEESVSLFCRSFQLAKIPYFQLSAKITILKYTKYELSAERETFIGFSTVTTVRADSNSPTDTVDTDCLTVAAVNRCYCRQINCEQGSYWRYSSASVRMLVAVQYQYKNYLLRTGTTTSNNTNSAAIFITLYNNYIALDQRCKSQILWSKMTYSPKNVS